MTKSMYQRGYDDGFRKKEVLYPLILSYCKGHAKGLKDKEFCETYSDEAIGVEGYGP